MTKTPPQKPKKPKATPSANQTQTKTQSKKKSQKTKKVTPAPSNPNPSNISDIDLAKKALRSVINDPDASSSSIVAASTKLLELENELGKHAKPKVTDEDLEETPIHEMSYDELSTLAQEGLELLHTLNSEEAATFDPDRIEETLERSRAKSIVEATEPTDPIEAPALAWDDTPTPATKATPSKQPAATKEIW